MIFLHQCTRLFTLDVLEELKKCSTFQIRNGSKSLAWRECDRLSPRTLGNGLTLALGSGESLRYPFSP